MNRFIITLSTLPFAAAAPAWAQSGQFQQAEQSVQSAQSTSGLEQAERSSTDVIVTATRTAEPADHIGQAVTVFDTATIERRQSVVVSDLLRETPGVTVVRNGGLGTVTGVSIRGAESDQTVALIDGIKLNDPTSPGGGFDFGNLLIGNIARIEVLRGAQSVLWGSQAIGGVVNVITRQPTDRIAVNARAEGGSYGTGQAFGNVSGTAGPIAASIGGGYLRTDGISAYDLGTERDGFHQYAGNASIAVTLADHLSVDLRGFYADGQVDIDGYPPPNYVFGDTREYALTKQALGYAGLNLGLFDDRLKNRAGYSLSEVHRRDINPDSVPTETFRGLGRTWRADYQGVLDLGPAVQSTFGVEHEVSRYTTSSYGGAATGGRARIDSVYGQLLVTPVTGLSVTGGVRHDDHSRFGGATTASTSAVWSPNGGATQLRASYSEGFKAPTLFQLQSNYGNATLRPERSTGWDAGLTQRALGGGIEASATWFHRVSKDLINFVSCPAQTGICVNRPYGTYDNVARAVSEGLEATLALHPAEALRVTGSYTYLNARDRTPGAGDGRRLAHRPSQSLTATIDYRWVIGLETGATVTTIGRSFDDAANRRQLGGYTLVGLRASLPVTRRVSVYGRIENLFDARYETVYQYGQLGRAAYGGIRLSY